MLLGAVILGIVLYVGMLAFAERFSIAKLGAAIFLGSIALTLLG
jgi:hypothetical protein